MVPIVYDGDGSEFNLEGPVGSDRIERYFAEHFYDRGRIHETAFDGAPIMFIYCRRENAGGLYSGRVLKPPTDLFGGEQGEAYDFDVTTKSDQKDKVNYEPILRAAGWALLTTLREELRKNSSTSQDARQAVCLDRRGVY